MRKTLILSLILACSLGAAEAQRGGGARGGVSGGGGRGGYSGGAASFRGAAPARSFAPAAGFRGYTPQARPGFAARPGYAMRQGYAVRPGYAARPAYASGRTYAPARPRYPERRVTYGGGYPYVAATWIAPDYLAFPDDFDDSYAPDGQLENYAPADNYVAAAPPQEPAYAGDVSGYQQPPQAYRAPQAPRPEKTTTLVFKDGRPNEQIHNYMLTRDTLTVINGDQLHDVAVADLDLAATEKVNRAAGVTFKLPVGN